MLRRAVQFAVMFGFLTAGRAQQIDIKMGTLAPEGSPWHKVLERMGERWRETSGGKVRLKIFAGTLGDEPDLVNKMRINQIQAVALTGAGMSDIEKGVGCFQIPMMIQSYEELDCVRDRLAPRLEKMIEARGYVVLNWGDAGWVHFFSKNRLNSVDELRKMKLFTWAGDADELELWKTSGFRPVPLAATDILMSLQTGLIDAVPSVPLMALWNQYFGLAPFMTDIKWAPLVGATVVSKATWEKIPQELRAPMLNAARDSGAEMRKGIRSMGDEAVKTMTAGQPGKRSVKLTVLHADAATLADWRKQTEAVYPKMRGKLFPAELFDEARRLCDECRARLGGGGR
ncbi:MAG: TRAP transporter substrate-binding protein DctP [Candidatus Solibacter sp.]|nr:TRAP transporter substrate-binding protein DctP [Candidatus Solibacter sp.]